MIHGIGIDIVDVARFKAALQRRGERFYKRLFTEGEIAYCLKQKRPEAHLSARFAAKVSLFKAMGRAFRYTDVEVLREASGAPVLKVYGLDKSYRFDISISHTDELSIAQTIVERAS